MEGSPNISTLFPEYHTRHDGEPFELADLWRPSAFVSSNTADTTLFPLPEGTFRPLRISSVSNGLRSNRLHIPRLDPPATHKNI